MELHGLVPGLYDAALVVLAVVDKRWAVFQWSTTVHSEGSRLVFSWTVCFHCSLLFVPFLFTPTWPVQEQFASHTLLRTIIFVSVHDVPHVFDQNTLPGDMDEHHNRLETIQFLRGMWQLPGWSHRSSQSWSGWTPDWSHLDWCHPSKENNENINNNV